MSRLRASLAPSDLDRAVAERVDRASRELEAAVGMVRRARGDYRTKRVERDLSRIIGSLQDVRTVAPRFGGEDPDMIPEDERNRMAREQREQERLVARAAVPAPVVTQPVESGGEG